MRNVPWVTAILCAVPLLAAPHKIDQKTFDTIATEMSGERAQELDRRIVEYHRIQGSPMMESVARDVILPALRAMNVEAAIEQFPSDGKTLYQTYVGPIGWTMRSGELWIVGDGRGERRSASAATPTSRCASRHTQKGASGAASSSTSATGRATTTTNRSTSAARSSSPPATRATSIAGRC